MTEDATRSDGELLGDFAATGNEAAFGELVSRHGPMVHSVCRRVLSDHHEAEDVAQAVFLTMARKARGLKGDSSVGGWLHRVAWCLAMDVRKARERRNRHEEAVMREASDANAEAVDIAAFRAELDTAVAGLPEKYRRPVVLFHLEERSVEETAGMLGLNPITLRTRLVRAREMLRAKLVRRGVAIGSVGALTTLLSAEAGATILPATFVSATAKAAGLAAAGQLAAGVGAGVVSVHVAALTKGVLNMMFWNSVKIGVAVAVGVAAVAGGGVVVVGELTERIGNPAIAANSSGENEMEKELQLRKEQTERARRSLSAKNATDEAARKETARREEEERNRIPPEWIKKMELSILQSPLETFMRADGSNVVPVKMRIHFNSTLDAPVLLDTYLLELAHLRFEIRGPDRDSVEIAKGMQEFRFRTPDKDALVLLNEHKDARTIAQGAAWYDTAMVFPGNFRGEHHRLTKPGVYRFKLIYENNIGVYETLGISQPPHWESSASSFRVGVWQGRLESKEILLTVVTPNDTTNIVQSGWYRAGEWVYRYHAYGPPHKGTNVPNQPGGKTVTSVGKNGYGGFGYLWAKDVPVIGKRDGETVSTPWGSMVWTVGSLVGGSDGLGGRTLEEGRWNTK